MKHRLTIRAMAIMFAQIILISSMTLTATAFFLVISAGIAPPLFLKPLMLLTMPVCSAIIISMPISAWVCQWYLRPLHQIRDAANRLATGDFSVRVDEWRGDGEIASLQRSFNQMAQELDGMEIFRSDFINTFSHEFKTPIVSIKGFAKQLKNETLTQAQREEYIDIIISESERLANMSSNVLLLSKFENVEIISDKEAFSLDEQIRTVILLLEKKWTVKNLELDIDLEPVSMYNNPEVIQHIWNNLLDNAVKFSPDNALLHISCRNNGNGQAIVQIRDHGIGMTPEQLAHIYDKFYQADASHITSGNGLGMSIVRRIVKLCDGSIDIRSTPGSGTTFTVILPLQ